MNIFVYRFASSFFFLKFNSLTLTIATCDYYFMLYYARLDEFIIHKSYTKTINLRKRMYNNYFFDVLHFILYILINVSIYVRKKKPQSVWKMNIFNFHIIHIVQMYNLKKKTFNSYWMKWIKHCVYSFIKNSWKNIL